MSTLLTSIKLASPLLLLIALGYWLKKIHFLDENISIQLSQLVLKVILPINIFVSIYNSDFKTDFDSKMILFIVLSNAILCIIMIVLSHFFTKDKRQLGALMQAGVRGNYSIFAMPLAVSIYGDRIAAPMAIAIAFLTPLYNVYSVALFEHYENGEPNYLRQFVKVMKTPIMVATILAIVFKIFDVVIPEVLYETLNYISKSLTAVSLMNLGLSFNFKINKKIIKLLVVALVFKLVIVPLVSIPAAIYLGFNNTALVVILVCATAPVATSAFSTAVCYNTDVELTNSAVVYSYIFCAITIPIFLSIVTSLGLI